MASTAAISVGLNPLFAAISGENLKNKTKKSKIEVQHSSWTGML